MDNNILEVKDLCIKNDKFHLDNVSFSLPRGCIMALLGKNGVGKTTLIRSLINQIRPTSGKVLFWGKELYGNEVEIKGNIGVVLEGLIYLYDKPKKVVKMISPFYENFDMEKYKYLMNKFGLDENKRLIKYSKGMKMKFNIIMAMCHNPDLLLLDEPTEGLDPVSRNEVMELLQEIIQDENKSILISTHIISDVEEIADYITLLGTDGMKFSIEREELLSKYAVISIYQEQLTEDLKKEIIGLKKNAFTYTGLVKDRSIFENIEDIKIKTPTIEEIMIYCEG